MRDTASDTGDDLLSLIQQWRQLWAMLNEPEDLRPHVVGAKLRELNALAKRIAASSRDKNLSLEELAVMTELELLILRDQLSSPLMRQAV